MNILIVYASKTHNTKTLAERFYVSLQENHQVQITDIKYIKEFKIDEFDLLVVGSWVNRNTVIAPIKVFLQSLNNKHIFLFGTLGANPNSEFGQKTYKNINQIPNNSNRILGTVLLNGYADRRMAKSIRLIPPFVVSKEIKQTMIDVMNASRYPTEDEYKMAINKLLTAVKSLDVK